MFSTTSTDIGKAFIESFVVEIIKNIEIKSILLDKQRILRAVKKIEEETFESKFSNPFQEDWEEEYEQPRIIKTEITEPVPLLPNYPMIPEKEKYNKTPLQESSPTKTTPAQSSASLSDLLTASSGKSLLDAKLPKANKQLMIRRQIPRAPPTMFKMQVPRIQIPHPAQVPKKQETKSKEVHSSPPTLITIEAFGKINNLLLDPTVQTLECPGPGKQITVYRSGFIQNANIFLTTNEIKNIMLEISEKTKIPIIPGVFKAALSNFIITAVVSEFVGTRFIIQKKEPSKLE